MCFPDQLSRYGTFEGGNIKMRIVLATILLIVAILAVVSVVRQLKYKNLFALAVSAIAALAFGFFSIATIIGEITG